MTPSLLARHKPIVGLTLSLVLAEKALHAAMQPGQQLTRLVVRNLAQHAVEQAPGDQRHKGARHPVPGAIADHHSITVIDRLEPEEVATDDVARLPDEEVVGRDRVELATGRQNGRLDTARVAQALQDELIGCRRPLLAFLDLGEVAVDGNRAAGLGAALADLEPAAIRAVLQQRLARMAMLGETLPDPALFLAFGVLDEAVRHCAADDLLKRRAGLRRPVAVVEQFAY
jgi:hypothetical protein